MEMRACSSRLESHLLGTFSTTLREANPFIYTVFEEAIVGITRLTIKLNLPEIINIAMSTEMDSSFGSHIYLYYRGFQVQDFLDIVFPIRLEKARTG